MVDTRCPTSASGSGRTPSESCRAASISERIDTDAKDNEVRGFDTDELQMLTYRLLRFITAFHHDTRHMPLLQLVQDNVIKQAAFTMQKLLRVMH